MGAGVTYAVGRIIELGDIFRIRHVAVAKLQDLHAGEMEFIPKLFHLFGDDPQVFRDDRKLFSQLFLHSLEQLGAGAFQPFAVDCVLGICRNRPVGFESAEMVDPYAVYHLELALDPADPPCVACFLMLSPVIQGIAPQLSGLREIIGRDAGHFGRISFGIQTEQFLLAPDITAVDCHEDRDVADDHDLFFVGVFLESVPLFLEQELREHIEADLIFQLLPVSSLRGCGADTDVLIPVEPAAALEGVLDCTEERIVIQPVCLIAAELFELLRDLPVSGCFLLHEMRVCLPQDTYFIFDRRAVIDLPGIPGDLAFQVIVLQKTVFFQQFGTYDVDLAGER